MKLHLFLVVMLSGFAGRAQALNINNPPTPVTYRPTGANAITPDTSLSSIEKAFPQNEPLTTTALPNGGQQVVLTNVSSGYSGGTVGEGTSTEQGTMLTIIVGKDGKIESYDMTQTVIIIQDVGMSMNTTDLGNDCFSDCTNSAKVAAAAAAAAKKNSAPTVISATTNPGTSTGVTGLQSQSTLAQSKAAVSASAP